MTLLESLKESFYLDPTVGTGLRRKIDVVGGRDYRIILVHKDSVAGNISPHGYWEVKHKYKTYKCHRIVFMLRHNMELTKDDVIDHVDGNRLNNSYDNLIISSPTGNARNKMRRKRLASNTGITGVSCFKDSRGNLYITASWCGLDKKQRWKRYSVGKYGYDEALSLATIYREERIKELQKDGAGYTERHGI